MSNKALFFILTVVALGNFGCLTKTEDSEGFQNLEKADQDVSGKEIKDYPGSIDSDIEDYFNSEFENFEIKDKLVYHPFSTYDSAGVETSFIDSTQIFVGLTVLSEGVSAKWQFAYDLHGRRKWELLQSE